MTSWIDGRIPLAKGARTKRPNPNFEQRKEQEELRKLVLLQGGNPGVVTRLPPSRRGSKGGGKRLSRQESLAAEHEREIREFQKGIAEVYHIEDYRQTVPEQQGEDLTPLTAVEIWQPAERPAVFEENCSVRVEDTDPFYWSRPEAYSPEAIERRRLEDEARKRDDAESRAFRAEMEAAVDRSWQNTLNLYRSASGAKPLRRRTGTDNVPPPSDSGEDAGFQAPADVSACVSHLELSPAPQPVEAPARRIAFGSSHSNQLAAAKTRKSKKEKQADQKAAVRLVKETKEQMKAAKLAQGHSRANRKK